MTKDSTAKKRLLKTAAAECKANRERCGLTVKELSKKSDVPPQVIYHLEGENHFPYPVRYVRLCAALGLARPPLMG